MVGLSHGANVALSGAYDYPSSLMNPVLALARVVKSC